MQHLYGISRTREEIYNVLSNYLQLSKDKMLPLNAFL